MNIPFRIAAVQAQPFALDSDRAPFSDQIRSVLEETPDLNMLVFPELHLFHSILESIALNHASLRDSAIALDDPLVRWLGELAAEYGIWLIPGSICEKGAGDETYNTALVFNPRGSWWRRIARFSRGVLMSLIPLVKRSPHLMFPTSADSDSTFATTRGSPRSAGVWPGWAPTPSSTL